MPVRRNSRFGKQELDEMTATKSAQQAIEEFVEAIAQHYLTVKSNEDQAGGASVAEEFVSAIEADLKSTLRDRLSQLETAGNPAEAVTVELSPSPAAETSFRHHGGQPGDAVEPTIEVDTGASPPFGMKSDVNAQTMELPKVDGQPVSAAKVDAGNSATSGDLSYDAEKTIDTGGQNATREVDGTTDTPADYRILSVLGRGGMGIVYKAHHVPLNRVVAVKMILSGANASDELLSRFQREAKAAAHLKHPNIVSVYEVGLHRGMPYFSLEFVEGESLSDMMKESTMSPQQAAKLLIPVARAIDYSHKRGVLHRDLKPQNILMTKDGEPKVADFGLAKRLDANDDDDEKTREGVVLGTPGYMAPEQIKNSNRVGPESDVYALGCILYYLLTGRPPFKSATPFETVRESLVREPLAPSKLQVGVDRDLETICLKTLEKEIAKRYASAGELADELQRFVDGQPIVARPITRRERLWKWCKRNPRTAMLTGLAASLLMCLMVGGIVSSIVINQKKNAEMAARQDAEAKERLAREQGDLAADTTRLLLYQTKDFFDENPQPRPLREPLMELVVKGAGEIYTEHEKYNVNDVFTASADLQLGELYLQAGAFDEAVTQLAKAEKQIEAIKQRSDVTNIDVSEMKVALAIGDAHRYLGNVPEAESYYLRLEKLRNAYFERHPQFSPAARQASLAEVYGRLANVYRLLGKPEKNLKYNLRSVEIRRDAVEAQPGSESALTELAGALTQLSTSYENAGDTELMLAASSEALEIQMRQGASKSDVATRHNIAKDQKVVARQYLLLDKNEQALRMLEHSTDTLDQLLKSSDDQRIKNQAIDAFIFKGLALDRLGRDSKAAYDRAEQLQRQMIAKSDNINARGMLLKILARAGKTSQAIELAEELAESSDEMYHCGYAACGFALVSKHLDETDARRSEVIDKAIQLTRKLIRHGYHDFEAIRSTDLDFEPIQANSEFQRMLDQEQQRLETL